MAGPVTVESTIGPCHGFCSARRGGGPSVAVFEFSTVTSTMKLQCGASTHRSFVDSDASSTMSRFWNAEKS